MPRDAFGNVIPGGFGPPINPSPGATRILGTQRALTNPAANTRNPMATAALQRANAGVVKPPAPPGLSPLVGNREMAAVDLSRQQARAALMGMQPRGFGTVIR